MRNMFGIDWFKRRWFDFRMGHGTYLTFLLGFTNFLLIVYNFLILQIPFLNSLFPTIFYFSTIGLLVYVPLATYIGYLHNRKQLATDVTIQADKNPYYKQLLENDKAIFDKLKKIEEKLNG